MNYRRVRCWTFANCAFDEANWSLTVDGRRVAVEGKPLELLRELLLRAGNLVSKAELLDAIWPDTAVVEASLPTAVHKLRLALHDDCRDTPIIETVPRIGYRLAVPVDVEELNVAPSPLVTVVPSAATSPYPAAGVVAASAGRASTGDHLRLFLLGGGLTIALALVAIALWPSHQVEARQLTQSVTERRETDYLRQWDAATALRKMDLDKIEQMLAAGWDPTTPLDRDHNGALNILLNNCEWDEGHDQRKMLLVARTLIDAGEPLDKRNAWGDTPYSIAKADRFCGPNHPVTTMIRRICYLGPNPLGDRCLAQYKTSERARQAANRPPS